MAEAQLHTVQKLWRAVQSGCHVAQCYAHAVLQHSLLVCRWVDAKPIFWSCMAQAMVLLAHLRL